MAVPAEPLHFSNSDPLRFNHGPEKGPLDLTEDDCLGYGIVRFWLVRQEANTGKRQILYESGAGFCC